MTNSNIEKDLEQIKESLAYIKGILIGARWAKLCDFKADSIEVSKCYHQYMSCQNDNNEVK